jgi:hypothetical protein
MLARMWQNRNPYTFLVGMQIITTIMENSIEIPQKKLETELSYNSVILLLGVYLKKCKIGYSRDTCTLMFIAALITTDKVWNQPRCPTTDEWILKVWYICRMEYYSS